MTVREPVGVKDPVPVFIADYGVHSSLMLPNEDVGGVPIVSEYLYGHWGWLAENKTGPINAPGALIGGSAALGRRDYESLPTQADLLLAMEAAHMPPPESLHEVRVERKKRAALLARLKARFESRLSERVENNYRGYWFVPDDQRYGLGNNCNHEVARWLAELGCVVDGAASTASIQVIQASVAAPNTTPDPSMRRGPKRPMPR